MQHIVKPMLFYSILCKTKRRQCYFICDATYGPSVLWYHLCLFSFVVPPMVVQFCDATYGPSVLWCHLWSFCFVMPHMSVRDPQDTTGSLPDNWQVARAHPTRNANYFCCVCHARARPATQSNLFCCVSGRARRTRHLSEKLPVTSCEFLTNIHGITKLNEQKWHHGTERT